MYSWSQIGIHEKPIAIYNINRFFEPLQTLIDHMIHEGFIDKKYQSLAPLCNNPEELFETIHNYKPLGVRSYD